MIGGGCLAWSFALVTGTPTRGSSDTMPPDDSANREQPFLMEQTHFQARPLRVAPMALAGSVHDLTTISRRLTTIDHVCAPFDHTKTPPLPTTGEGAVGAGPGPPDRRSVPV